MLKPPGQNKFKLKRLAEPIIDKATGMKYEFVAPELQDEPPCHNCYRGFLYVAYGIHDGKLWDIYKFPCKCSHTNGLEYWQMDDLRRYANRPVEYQYSLDEMPPYVFIHPVHNQEMQVGKLVKAIVDGLASHEQEGVGERVEQAAPPF